jgi:hypothetical protein
MTSARLEVVILAQNDRHRLPVFILDVAHRIEEVDIEGVTITVIDNGSRDGSDEIVEAMAKSMPFLKLVRFETSLSESDLLMRSLSEVEAEYLLLFIRSGVSPQDIESYLLETGGKQFASLVGKIPSFKIGDPKRWSKYFCLKIIDGLTPKNSLSLRSFGILIHKDMAQDLLKNIKAGGEAMEVLRANFIGLEAVSKRHIIDGGPILGFRSSLWRMFWSTLKVRLARLGRS